MSLAREQSWEQVARQLGERLRFHAACPEVFMDAALFGRPLHGEPSRHAHECPFCADRYAVDLYDAKAAAQAARNTGRRSVAGDDEVVIGTTEAAAILGRSHATVARWAQNGTLLAKRRLPGRNGGYLFDRREVEAYRDEVLPPVRPRPRRETPVNRRSRGTF
jgi:hypothetical protein